MKSSFGTDDAKLFPSLLLFAVTGVTILLHGDAAFQGEEEVPTKLIINIFSDPLCNFIGNIIC